MSKGTLVTAAEIARLANVGRAAVSNWRRRHPDFPEPVVGPEGTSSFRLDEVERWLHKQGKLAGDGSTDAILRALEISRGDVDVMELVADVVTYLRDPRAVQPPKQVRDVLDGFTGVPRDELVESLCARVFDRQQRQHLATPHELALLMVELAAPVAGTVFDPACGTGGFLLAAMEHLAARSEQHETVSHPTCGSGDSLRASMEYVADKLVGQEINDTLVRLARARLAPNPAVNIASGDALRADAFSDLRADVILCDPPFGYRDWGHEELGLDPRWEYGFPVKGEPELAWIQHCLSHLKPGGRAVLALPAGVASRRSGRSIRQALLRRGAVRAVIALPAGVLMSTGIPIHLWVLRNPDASGADPVLLLDASHHRPSRRGQADWRSISEDVLGAWREFSGTGTVTEVPGRQRAVEPIELLDEDVDLTPARHLPQPTTVLDLRALSRTRKQLTSLLGELDDLLPDVRKTDPGPGASVTVNDLARAGALVLRQQVGPLDTTEDGEGSRVLTGRDVVTGAEPTACLADSDGQDVIDLHPGDLVVPLLVAGDGRPRARVIDGEGMVLGPNLQLIRVDETRLDVHFLAGQIRAGSGGRAGSTTASGVHRIDVRRVEIPMLDLERQQRFGRAFQQLDTFTSGLHQAVALGVQLATELADGLADGVVDPVE